MALAQLGVIKVQAVSGDRRNSKALDDRVASLDKVSSDVACILAKEGGKYCPQP